VNSSTIVWCTIYKWNNTRCLVTISEQTELFPFCSTQILKCFRQTVQKIICAVILSFVALCICSHSALHVLDWWRKAAFHENQTIWDTWGTEGNNILLSEVMGKSRGHVFQILLSFFWQWNQTLGLCQDAE
jgi:hypothetical protein